MPRKNLKKQILLFNGTIFIFKITQVTNRTHQLQLLQQQRQKIRESSAEVLKIPTQNQAIAQKATQKAPIENRPSVEAVDDDNDEDLFYEYEEIDDEQPTQVEIKTTLKPEEENKPVILTSNFFLPGKPIPKLQQNDFESQQPNDLSSDIGEANDRDKDNAEDVIDALPEEDTERIAVEKTTKKAEIQSTTAASSRNQHVKPVTEDPVEYEYEYEYIDEPTTEVKSLPKPTDTKYIPAIDDNESTTIIESDEPQQSTDEAPELEFTLKPEAKTMKSISSTEQIETSVGPVETSSVSSTEMTENAVDSTEGYVVVASVQTSRSISGARYLTFPQVEQEEKRQSLSEAIKDAKRHQDEDYHNESISDDSHKADDLVKPQKQETISAKEVESTEEPSIENHETSIERQELKDDSDSTPQEILKTKVHKLSSISEKLAHLHELNEPKPEITTKPQPVVIRKFSPRTTTKTPRKLTAAPKKPNFDIDPELASLLPPGYKIRANSLSESTTASTTTSTSTTTPKIETTTSQEKDPALEIAKKIQFKEISFDGLESFLPKGYKPPPSESKPKAENSTTNSDESLDILSKIKFDDTLAALLPKDYKPSTTLATKAPIRLSTLTEDISKFLPPGFKLPKESMTTKRPQLKTTMDDISKFLPPGFKLPKSTTTTTETPEAEHDSGSGGIDSVLNKVSFKVDISSLLPPGFKPNATPDDSASKENSESNEKSSSNATSANSGFKLVFPKGIGKRPGVRLTTPRPSSHVDGPTQPGITIRKGLPTR